MDRGTRQDLPGQAGRVGQWIHGQLQDFGMLLAAGRTGTVFNSADLREFPFREWLSNTSSGTRSSTGWGWSCTGS